MKKTIDLRLVILLSALWQTLQAQEPVMTRKQEIESYANMTPDIKNVFDFLYQKKLIDMPFIDFLHENVSDENKNEESNIGTVIEKSLDLIEATIKDSCLWSFSSRKSNFIVSEDCLLQSPCFQNIMKKLILESDSYAWTQTNNLRALAKIHRDDQLNDLLYLDDSFRLFTLFEVDNLYEYLKKNDKIILSELHQLPDIKRSISLNIIKKFGDYIVSQEINLHDADPEFAQYLDNYKNNKLIPIFTFIMKESTSNNIASLIYTETDSSGDVINEWNFLTIVFRYDALEIVKILVVSAAQDQGRVLENICTYDLLHLAVGCNAEACMNFFIQAGVDINQYTISEFVNPDGLAPLHVAAQCGNTRMIEKLIAYGADINLQDVDGLTPLHHALSCRRSTEEYTEYVREKLNPSHWIPDEHGMHHLVGYFIKDYIGSTIHFLLDHNAQCTIADKNGKSPYSIALSENNKKLMNMMKASPAYDDKNIES